MQLNNLNIAVLGAGRSGRAAARLAMKHGARVCVFDASSSIDGWPEDIPLHTAATEEDGRAFHADMVVISPGIETDSPFVKSFGREGMETIGEMELACRFYHGPIIAAPRIRCHRFDLRPAFFFERLDRAGKRRFQTHASPR